MEDICEKCQVPFSTYATRRFCLYCNFSRDSAVKLQTVTFKSDGLSRMFRIPTFKKVYRNSLKVKLNDDLAPEAHKFERLGADLYLRLTKKSGDPIPPGYTITVEWEDYNK